MLAGHAACMSEVTVGGRYRDALRVPEFRALAGSSLVSILGDTAAFLAVTVLIYQHTGSALLAALVFAVAFVPHLFGGTLLSGLVDRIPPRRLLIGCDLIGAALVAAIALPAMPVLVVFLALFVIGTLAPVRGGVSGALVAEILPGDSFVPGRSILRILSQTSQILGAAAGGVLIAPLGPRGALLADTVSLLLSAGLIGLAIRPRPVSGSARRQSLIADSLAGLGEVWRQPGIRSLLLLGWLVPFVAVAPEALAAPALAQSGHRAALIGLWLSAIPAGTVLGDLLIVWTIPAPLRDRLTWPLALALPATMVGFVLGPPLPVAIGILVIAGMLGGYGLGLDQRVRALTPQALLGRTYALSQTGLMVAQGLGFAAAGALGDVLDAATTIAVAGGCGLASVLLLAATSRAGRIRPSASA